MSDRDLPSALRRFGRILGFAMCATVTTVACSSTPPRDTAAFCTAYVDTARLASKITNPDDLSLASLQRQVRTIDDRASDAGRRAPDEIADTVQRVIEPLHTLRKDLDDADSRSASSTALSRYRDTVTKVTADQKRLDAWATTNCGIVPASTTTTPITIQPGLTG